MFVGQEEVTRFPKLQHLQELLLSHVAQLSLDMSEAFHDDNDSAADTVIGPTPGVHGRYFAVCVHALGRLGVSYHTLQHAYASTATGTSTRTKTIGGASTGSGVITDSGLSLVLTVVSPHLMAHSLSTLLHGLTLLAANTPSGNGDSPTIPSTAVPPPPPESALDTHPPVVALPPALFRAVVSVRDALTPQGVALTVYSLGKLGYTLSQLEGMGVHYKETEERDDNNIVTPSLTEALLSAIAGVAPRMNAQVP